MKLVTQIATACLLAALAVFVTSARAQESNVNDRTFMTFSSSVELPGVTLEPGTYEFRLADSPAKNVVQVLRKDSREPMGQWTFVPSERPKVSDDTVVMFKETREGSTPAVQYWYFPNEKIGKEFVYPKDQAEKIAARTGQAVQSPDGVVTPSATASASASRDETAANEQPSADSASADSLTRNAPASSQPTAAAGSTTGNRGVSAESREQPASETPRPAAAESVQARAESAAPVAPAPRPVGTSGSTSADQQSAGAAGAQPTESRELPETASPLALTGLIGLLSLAGAFGMRAFRG